MKLVKQLSVVLSLLLIVGCSAKQNQDYLNSKNGKMLVIKAPLSAKQIDNTYDLPKVGKIAPQNIEPPVN